MSARTAAFPYVSMKTAAERPVEWNASWSSRSSTHTRPSRESSYPAETPAIPPPTIRKSNDVSTERSPSKPPDLPRPRWRREGAGGSAYSSFRPDSSVLPCTPGKMPHPHGVAGAGPRSAAASPRPAATSPATIAAAPSQP